MLLPARIFFVYEQIEAYVVILQVPGRVSCLQAPTLSTAASSRLDLATEKWELAKVVEGEELW